MNKKGLIMTIAKKLLIIGLVTFGMHQGTQAHTNEASDEISQVLDFAQTLQQGNNKDTLKIAEWLKELAFKYSTQDHMICWLCCDILVIAHVINSPQLTMQSKLSALSQKMKIHNIKEICCGIALATVCAAYIKISIDIIMGNRRGPK
jgi:hypothetical protein